MTCARRLNDLLTKCGKLCVRAQRALNQQHAVPTQMGAEYVLLQRLVREYGVEVRDMKNRTRERARGGVMGRMMVHVRAGGEHGDMDEVIHTWIMVPHRVEGVRGSV